MFVPCPHCGFLVALIVRPDGAPQRCPRCDGLVQADAGTPDEPAATDAPVPDEDPAPLIEEEPAVSVADAAGSDTPTDATAPAASYEDAIAAVSATAAAPRARRSPRPRRSGAPSFARHAQPRAPVRTSWRWHAGIAALALLLALQLLLAQRQELAADPRWRPLVAGLCSVLRCEVPAWREPAAFTMLQRSVRPKPGESGVLAVEASFRNDARWAQSWPLLVLSLSDVDGRPVGQRAFRPEEYRRTHRAGDELLPGQSATVTFEVIEPAPRIVAFTFDFR